MTEDRKPFQRLSMEQYRQYMNLLRQTSLQRAISNYFFILINVLIIMIGYIFVAQTYIHLFIFAMLSVIGIILSLYWLYELRESYIMSEVRFRTIMELESALFKHGALSKEWERLGRYKFRRSPVFYVLLGRLLPVVFVAGHIGGLMFSLMLIIMK